MKVNIEITEGCTSFSYLINGIEWVDLVKDEEPDIHDKEAVNNINFVNKVCDTLINEIKSQYNLPAWIIGYLWDGEYDTYCTQDTFIKLVKNNKNTKEEYLGTCDECGDSIYRWKLEIEIE